MIVGIDVSKSTFDVSYDYQGCDVHRCYDYTDEGIKALLSDTPEDAQYVMEATGVYHTRLAVSVYDSGQQVSVVNPVVIKRFGQMHLSRVKSDKADAVLIRRYGEQQSPLLWSPSSQAIVELKQAHSWLDDLIGERTRLLNRQESLRHQACPSGFVLNQMTNQLVHLDEQIRECEGHLDVVVKKYFPELYAR